MSLSTRSSVAMNGEEPPIDKKKDTSEAYPILPLPDDLVLSCLARVSRLYYPTLSLVSQSFPSLLSSPELYETRSLLGRTESCLYVCLRLPPDFKTTWFTLCRRPDHAHKKKKKKKKKKNKKKKSSENLLIPIPSLQSHPVNSSGLLAVGSSIYNFGGHINDVSLSTVSILDCKSHTWCEAPSMLVERAYPVSSLVDGKIYVAGGCDIWMEVEHAGGACWSGLIQAQQVERAYPGSKWMEVFDLKKQTWEFVSSPLVERWDGGMNRSAVIDGEIFMFGNKGLVGVAYKPKEDKWQGIGAMTNLALGWGYFSHCVVDNVLYSYSNQDGIKWYDPKIGDWSNLKGLVGLPKFADYSRVKLVDYGGKMVILWDKSVPCSGYTDKMIWCAAIVLERPNNQEIWGKVEWLDAVLQVPKKYQFVCALSATL
ncbi:PREDICTED: F-box/kelch-repeat protein At5g49000-like [Camelina sativa]|uniref:F-box/kelch-repeat protein At5g49000-like n=1 Tax=Camelina sativa TaxID=90675 RepID=A0ABM0UUD9_CAMSA|nr:PREDICTED: F-box/kelch-repeat protein At5g49000-like [Camelina sativa]